MKLFKDTKNKVFGFDDDQIKAGMAEGLTEISQAEFEALKPDPKTVSVSMRQARLALHGAGLLPDVQNAIDGLTEPDRTQAAIEWEYASTVDREGPITQMLAGAMGLTSAELDQLFETAAGL